MVIVSLQTASLPLPPPFSAERLWQSSQEKKSVEENNNFSVNNARYSASGRADPSNAFLTARVLSRNRTVKNEE